MPDQIRHWRPKEKIRLNPVWYLEKRRGTLKKIQINGW
jgi:hypothetical protein